MWLMPCNEIAPYVGGNAEKAEIAPVGEVQDYDFSAKILSHNIGRGYFVDFLKMHQLKPLPLPKSRFLGRRGI
jgi:hypothetical protein